MGGAKGTQATGSGFRAAVYARLEEISFRTGLITAASALVVLAALTTAGVLVAGRGQGAHRADASPVITSSAAAPVATLASVPPASPVSTAKPVPSSTQQATHAPVTTDATASRAVATPQPTAGSPTAAQATG